MKTTTLIIIIVAAIVVIGAGIFLYLKFRGEPSTSQLTTPTSTISETQTINKGENMEISSPAFQENQKIPAKYTCDLDNVNPQLIISGVPEEAQSLVLTLDDPDAAGGTWSHWTVWNIDPKTTEIAENSVPANAVQGKTSFDKSGYGGPCPAQGQHRYVFHLYALNSKLNLPEGTAKPELDKAMAGHVISEAKYTGVYKLSDN